MGYFDDMKVMLGRGMNAADRKTQELRLQAELSRINSSLVSACAALGKVVYSHPMLAVQVQRECPSEYNAITSLIQDEQNVRSRIEDLQRQAVITSPASRQTRQFLCTKCGTPVTLDLSYCPSCGDNLSELKSQYRMCPSCGTYHTLDSRFCMQCGSLTVEIPISPSFSDSSVVAGNQNDTPDAESYVRNESQADIAPESSEITEANASAAEDTALASETQTCPNCGAAIGNDDVFCVECGTRLIE